MACECQLEADREILRATMLAFLAAVLFILTGCATIRTDAYRVDVPQPPLPAGFTAGAAKVDITPPPGYPLGGHSLAAPSSRGHWMRLFARAFVLRDRTGNTVVLVSCDLFAIPGGLHAKVAESLARSGFPLAPQNLVIAATHTHQGPGNYLSSSIYNKFASNKGGFDERLFQFLVRQIVGAVSQARAEADSALGKNHKLVFRSGLLCGFARNRASDPFEQNPQEFRDRVLALGDQCSPAIPGLRYRAVDPTLRVLEIQRESAGNWERAGLMVFFSVHATTMSHDTPVYSPDLPGYAMAILERRLSTPGADLVAGFFNGAEGDVSPIWRSQNRNDLQELGDRMASEVTRLIAVAGHEDLDPVFDARGRNDRWQDLRAKGLKKPEFGIAALGGAEDGRFFLYNLGCHAGVTEGCGPSIVLRFSTLAKIAQCLARFPERVPISLVHLGKNLTLLTLPFEATTTAGLRLREATCSDRAACQEVVIVGLANEYLSYLATAEEFERQAYEGASTVFGKGSQDALRGVVAGMAAGQTPCPPCTVPGQVFKAGRRNDEFGPKSIGAPRSEITEGLEGVFPDESNRLNERVMVFEWEETPPSELESDGRRQVSVVLNGTTIVADQTGIDLAVVVVGPANQGFRFAAVWLPPLTPNPVDSYAFTVKTSDGRTCNSDPFRITAGATGKRLSAHCGTLSFSNR